MSWSQKQRAEIIAETYKKWNLKDKKVLDVGCGNGVVSKVLIETLNFDLTGTDILDYRKENIPFKKMETKNKLPFDDNSFQFVMLNDILHHAEDIEKLIIESSRLAPNLLIFEDKESILLKILDVGLNYLYCNKMPVPFNFKTEEEWCLLFKKLGFNYEKAEISYPFWYPLRHMSFKLCKKN